MLPLLKIVVFAGLILLGAVAVVLGLIVTTHALSTGLVGYSVGTGAAAVATTLNRATDPDGFWRVLSLTGGLPILLGLISAGIGWRGFRG